MDALPHSPLDCSFVAGIGTPTSKTATKINHGGCAKGGKPGLSHGQPSVGTRPGHTLNSTEGQTAGGHKAARGGL